MSKYYNYEVCMIDTDAGFNEGHPDQILFEDTEVVRSDDDGERRWRLGGLDVYRGLNREDLEKIFDDWWENGGWVAKIAVRDDGEHGGGIWLDFKHVSGMANEEDVNYLSISITPTQAAILGTALINITKMREAQKG